MATLNLRKKSQKKVLPKGKYDRGDQVHVILKRHKTKKLSKIEIGYIKWKGIGSFKAFNQNRFEYGLFYRVELTQKNRGKTIYIQENQISNGKRLSRNNNKNKNNNDINIGYILKDLIQLWFVGIRIPKSKKSLLNKSVDGMNGIPKTCLRIYVDVYTFKIRELKIMLRKEYIVNKKCQILLIYNNEVCRDDKTLNYYCIQNESSILVCISEIWNIKKPTQKKPDFKRMTERQKSKYKAKQKKIKENKIKEKKMQLKMHKNRLKTLGKLRKFKVEMIKDLDILTYEFTDDCVKMQCGHGIPMDSLIQYCQSKLNDGFKEIRCPRTIDNSTELCNKVWNFEFIRKVLMECIKPNKNQWINSLDGLLIFGFVRKYCKNNRFQSEMFLKYPFYILNNMYHFFSMQNAYIEQHKNVFHKIPALYQRLHKQNKAKIPKKDPKQKRDEMTPKQLSKLKKAEAKRKKEALKRRNEALKKLFKSQTTILELENEGAYISDMNINDEKDDYKFDSNEFKFDFGDDIKTDINQNDIMNLELSIARNIFKDKFDFQKCLKCQTILFRNKTQMIKQQMYTECPLCSNYKRKHIYKFCWMCNRQWIGTKKAQYCQSQQCTLSYMKQNIEILSKCPTKSIGGYRCPNTRACPKCSQLIMHWEACKHMRCTRCQTSFCFICLKPMLNGRWQCGSYNSRCPGGTHKRQTLEHMVLPNRVTVELF